ncbi:hypothetical protein BT96DRAFT_93110 [Gymnopus androsaceus JB14]|uniref:Uncharacterized protein n=1 Tax=Gymnopus androsaceus JB14 TaxID=1447944 RepID=A0A6A4HGH2_9AGAR|nr:hypothetical protein BT96DRAFT_93110 [Gymnopus androsaceus JB14]
MFFRVTSFSFFAFVAFVIAVMFFCIVFVGSNSGFSKALNVLIALFPLVAVLTFGTQGDLMRALAFWRRNGKTVYSQDIYSDGLPLTRSSTVRSELTVVMVSVEVETERSDEKGSKSEARPYYYF